MIDQLRSEGNMVYINKTDKGTSYRLGTPTKSIIAAGIRKLYKVLNTLIQRNWLYK